MNKIKELLQDADPLRNESAASLEYRDGQRRTVLAAASSAERREKAIPNSKVRFVAMLAAAAIAVLFLSERIWSPLIRDVYAAVRFEVRLAEDQPAPGLREAKVAGTDRSIYLHEEVVVTNADIATASLIRVGSVYNVGVEFNGTGAAKMRAATGRHIGKPVAILLDGQVIMAPVLRSPIDSSAQITGNFTKAEAERVVTGIIGK